MSVNTECLSAYNNDTDNDANILTLFLMGPVLILMTATGTNFCRFHLVLMLYTLVAMKLNYLKPGYDRNVNSNRKSFKEKRSFH